MTLTLIYLFANANNSLECNYTAASGVPIPVLGDDVADTASSVSYPVKYRTFQYNGADNLTIFFSCFDGTSEAQDKAMRAALGEAMKARLKKNQG